MKITIYFSKFFYFSALCMVVFFLSCTEGKDKPKLEQICIDIQPFKGIAQQVLDSVYKELLKVYPNIRLNKAIPLPIAAHNNQTKRYRADSLIKYLSSITPAKHVTLGLTHFDISHTKGKIQDYGIFGLGYQPGNSCVVSYYRLSKTNLLAQLFKIAIHELGHTQGLKHCLVKTCFMRDAAGKNPTNEETGFCDNCNKQFFSKIWGSNINKPIQ